MDYYTCLFGLVLYTVLLIEVISVKLVADAEDMRQLMQKNVF